MQDPGLRCVELMQLFPLEPCRLLLNLHGKAAAFSKHSEHSSRFGVVICSILGSI